MFYLESYFSGHGWGEGVAYHTAGYRFLIAELPVVRKALQPGQHPGGESGHPLEVCSWSLVTYTSSVDSHLSPCLSGTCWPQIRTTMLLAATNERGSNLVCFCSPLLGSLLAVGRHQVE